MKRPEPRCDGVHDVGRAQHWYEQCWPSGAGKHPRTISQVVDAYIRDRRADAALELSFFRQLAGARGAIRLAALAKVRSDRPHEMRKHPHRWRLPNSILRRFAERLLVSAVHRSRTFDDLHERVRAAHICGIGELAIYDTALRIAAYLGLSPKRVYLHSGTRKGAAALGLGRGRRTIEVRELPRPLRRLRPHEIEDCLCIYGRELRRCATR